MGLRVSVRHRTKFRGDSTTADTWRLSFFCKTVSVRHRGFAVRVLAPPVNRVCRLYKCEKFGGNIGGSFGNMHF